MSISPGGPGGSEDQPNDFFAQVKENLGPYAWYRAVMVI